MQEPGTLPLLAAMLQPRWPHTAVPQGPQAVGTAPVHMQSGPSALRAPGSRPALTPATTPKCWAQREQCSPRKARAGSAQQNGDNQGLRSTPAHPDASGLVQPGQGLSWMPNQQEGENRGGTRVSAAGTLPEDTSFLLWVLTRRRELGALQRELRPVCAQLPCDPEGGSSPWVPRA